MCECTVQRSARFKAGSRTCAYRILMKTVSGASLYAPRSRSFESTDSSRVTVSPYGGFKVCVGVIRPCLEVDHPRAHAFEIHAKGDLFSLGNSEAQCAIGSTDESRLHVRLTEGALIGIAL